MLGLACLFLESSTLSGSPSPFLAFYSGCHCPGWCAYDVGVPLYWHAALFVLRSLPIFVLSPESFLKDSEKNYLQQEIQEGQGRGWGLLLVQSLKPSVPALT